MKFVPPQVRFDVERLTAMMPAQAQQKVAAWLEYFNVLSQIREPRVMASLAPSAIRGLFLKVGRRDQPTSMKIRHEAVFDWTYPNDFPEMSALYEKAKRLQWNGSVDLPWDTDVDPGNTEVALLPANFLAWDAMADLGIKPDAAERLQVTNDLLSWLLSQFLHGEQGALFAAAQVTEAVPFFDGKYYGASQVMDEARHVEVFHRYLSTKIEKSYQINDNLFTIIDSLMTDSRWDMKFLGMQIMVEGLALGAFSMLHRITEEPLLKELLRRVIHDEARHVHYGVLALKRYFQTELTSAERREREEWSFEVAMLMRNRFLAHELYEERFEGLMTRREWNTLVERSPGFHLFRRVMFRRLVPNLREIGLLSDRVRPRYEKVGLGDYIDGPAAPRLSAEEMLNHGGPSL